MIKVVKMGGGQWCGMEIGSCITEIEIANIEAFVNTDGPVLLCATLEEAQEYLSTDDIEMVG